jgi:hypothetical protein
MMIKQICFLIGVVLTLALAGPALAQEPITPQHSDPGWQVSYWNNTSLSGPPVRQGVETNLDYNWGRGAPAPGVNADQFSARWTRYIDVSPGNYRFTVTADDGIRLWIDNELIIDQWRHQAATTYNADRYLGPGHHLVVVDYFENTGEAVVRVSLTQASPPPPPPPPAYSGWRAEYFNNKSLSGPPALIRDEAELNYNWGHGSPAPGYVSADNFSVRWSRSLNLAAGNYRFNMTVDDGARLYVNGHLLIDAWLVQAPRAYSGDIYLTGGPVTLQMEYFENTGGAVAQLSGTIAPAPPPPPPSPPGNMSCYVRAHSLNVRSGPGLGYQVIGRFYQGQWVYALGRNFNGRWLLVEVPGDFRGWVSAAYVRPSGSIRDLPILR